MSAAAATADLPLPSRSGRLLSLVRKLWDYGMLVSASLHQQPPITADGKTHLVRTFGISNVMVILVRIALGMKRARFLAERIASTAAQIDAGSSQAEPKPSPRATPACPGTHPRAPKPYPEPPPTDGTLALIARLPTVSQIARRVPRQPIGAVLADICRDLGISRGDPLWDELQAAITEFGGSLATRARDKLKQAFPIARTVERPKPQPVARPEPPGTGPPMAVPA